MPSEITPDSDLTRGLLEQYRQGDSQALDRLLERCHPELYAFVEARLDPHVRARVDPSDVVQEAQLVGWLRHELALCSKRLQDD
jgi:DNA-directed RNA polymerase specialized sigma24 family protein